jgi:hypothetical protein
MARNFVSDGPANGKDATAFLIELHGPIPQGSR